MFLICTSIKNFKKCLGAWHTKYLAKKQKSFYAATGQKFLKFFKLLNMGMVEHVSEIFLEISCARMVNRCVVLGCPGGYRLGSKDGVKLFCFPKDPALLEKWLQALPRKDFHPKEHSRLCSMHFKQETL